MVTVIRNTINGLFDNVYVHHSVLVGSPVFAALLSLTNLGAGKAAGIAGGSAVVSAVLHSLDGLLPTPKKNPPAS